MSPSSLALAAWIAVVGPIGKAGPATSPELHKITASSREYRACGVNCLYAACRLTGIAADLERVDSLLHPDSEGMNTLAELDAAATALGFTPVAVKLSMDQLARVPAPAILHVKHLAGEREGNHFLVYLGRTPDGATVCLDPPFPPEELDPERFRHRWTGYTLALFRTPKDAEAFKSELALSSKALWREPLFWTACGLGTSIGFVCLGGSFVRRPSGGDSAS